MECYCDCILNITAAPNNATVGSLYHLLDPQTAKKFPPAQSFGGSPGVTTSCPFPQDRVIFESRSVCNECICNSTCSQTSVLNNNVNFNLTSTQGTLCMYVCPYHCSNEQFIRGSFSPSTYHGVVLLVDVEMEPVSSLKQRMSVSIATTSTSHYGLLTLLTKM